MRNIYTYSGSQNTFQVWEAPQFIIWPINPNHDLTDRIRL